MYQVIPGVSLKRAVLLTGLLMMMVFPGMLFAGTLPPVKTVFIIMEENHDWSDILFSPSAPYINQTLLPISSYCSQYYNPYYNHPSEANYVWLEAGSNLGIVDDGDPYTNHQSTTNHLTSLLNRAGISWKAYMEDFSGGYVPLTLTNRYTYSHNPMVFFDDITGTNDLYYPYGVAHIRPITELAGDLASNNVARYNFITPNLCGDMHDPCGGDPISHGDTWLSYYIPLITNSAAYSNGGAIFITWDESETSDGPIGMIVLSPLARGGGYSNSVYYTHSSTLRTFQEIFNVGPLLRDAANATDLIDLFTVYQIKGMTNLSNGACQFIVDGTTAGKTNIVERSADLLSWTPISTNVAATFSLTITDPAATGFRSRFYRSHQLP